MRAAASLPESARLVGINTSWMIALGWGMAAAIGADRRHPDRTGGVPGAEHDGRRADLRVCRRRARRPDLPLGAVVGGFLVGVFENLAGTYIPGVGNELKLPIALALIITVLVVKPAGLFGRPIVKRV